MKKILGLDLGTSSIGWALIGEENNQTTILGMGTRIVPLITDEKDEFTQGNSISKNQKRTQRRTQRKCNFRYKLRRWRLTQFLRDHSMLPGEELWHITPLEIWGLRARAVYEKVELPELGRILYHLNQKRGYKSMRKETSLKKEETEYVEAITNRYQEIKQRNITIGQKFYEELLKDPNYRTKQQVFPREAYIEEFNAIMAEQQKHYPDLIDEEFIRKLRDEIIYYQRSLKSQKSLVKICEFEGKREIDQHGRMKIFGPKVAPKSSPVFQLCKIWETINNLTLKNKFGKEYHLTLEEKQRIADYLNNHEKLTGAELLKMLGLSKDDGWYYNKQLERGIQGNLTRAALRKILPENSSWLRFNLVVKNLYEESGEPKIVSAIKKNRHGDKVKIKNQGKIIENTFVKEPLYQLWHVIYSLDRDSCLKTLTEKFGMDQETAEKLANLDFKVSGFGNKSVRAMRKILPYLMEGYQYSDACQFAGYDHSGTLTRKENLQRPLLDRLGLLPKNSLRQPVVEKILNQMINLVNAILDKYGRPDEIRIELARELKQNQEERNNTFKNLRRIERENEMIRKRLIEEYQVKPSRNNIIKWRLFHEINGDESKISGICIYCGKPFGLADALRGEMVDVEHIIPRSLLFDDSQSNKTLSHRACNEAKGNRTAHDFMKQKGEAEYLSYVERVNNLYKSKKISKTKRDKLLMQGDEIPKDFIERQMRETAYVSRKAREILSLVCHNVWVTSGGVTEYLRRLWGWNDILMNLNLPRYREAGLTELEEVENSAGQKHTREVIKNWTKRDDHRHHAIDALVIACTKQGFIQRINNLSSQGVREAMYREIQGLDLQQRENLSLLEKYLIAQRPLTTHQVASKAAEILVSFKPGKKVATYGRRTIRRHGRKIIVQRKIIVPRGPLSEESVYGKIKIIPRDPATGKIKYQPLKYLFENPHLIVKAYIRKLVEERLAQFDNDPSRAYKSTKDNPIYLDAENTIPLEYASCFEEKFVIRYPLSNIKPSDVDYIVDNKVRELVRQRLEEYKGKEKEAFKEPLWLNREKGIQIKHVRCITNLQSPEPIKYNNEGIPVGFVKPGNNHHIAFYRDQNGKMVEHVCTFWHAVERKKYGIPVILHNPSEVWNHVLQEREKYPDNFLNKLPEDGWTFLESMQQNEMFLLGMDPDDLKKALETNDKSLISKYLYRVQKLTSRDYYFRHHLETQLDDSSEALKAGRFLRIQSISTFVKYNPVKIFISNLGEIEGYHVIN